MRRYIGWQCAFVTVFLTLGCSLDWFEDGASWEKLNRQTVQFYQEQQFAKAAKEGRQALSVARRDYAGGEQVAISLSNLAMISLSLGDNAESERLEKESLALRASIFGENDLKLVVSLHHLAYVYVVESIKNGNEALRSDAETCLLQAQAIMEKAHGKGTPATIPSLEKLEKFYKITKNAEKEQEVARRRKEIR